MTTEKKEEKKIGKDVKRDFILDGTVGEDTIRKLVDFILDVNAFDVLKKEEEESYKPKPINIIVNTYGGSLYDANLAIGVIENSSTPVHTYCHGKAMSAGFYIFSSGHRRFASPLATFMYHDASVGITGAVSGLGYTLKHYEGVRDVYDKYMLSVTNLPKHIMDEKKKIKEDWYMSTDEAFGYGLVDEIIPFRNKMTK